ncbi:MAG: AraC family transcriptional regulator [Spirochaetes bacterium]|nr:AraC family transcriptional regulator [Spirochaetota bacterium]
MTARDEYLASISLEEQYGRHGIAIQTGAYCAFDKRTTNMPHMHSYYELCLVTSGSGVYYHGDAVLPLSAGDVFIADPSVRHEITSHTTKDLRLMFVTFTVTSVDAPLSDGFEDQLLDAFLKRHTVCGRGRAQLFHYLPLLAEPSVSSGRTHFLRRSLASFAFELIGTLTDVPAAEHTVVRSHAVEKALGYITANVNRRISVCDVAAAAGTSERNLRHLFKKSLHARVIDTINEYKISRAAQLAFMHFKIYEIAYAVGIEEPSQFTRLFKKRFGISPKQYQLRYAPDVSVRRTVFAGLPNGSPNAGMTSRTMHKKRRAHYVQ